QRSPSYRESPLVCAAPRGLARHRCNVTIIKKRMQDTGLFKQYTLQGALDKLDIIECFTAPGQALRVGEILEKQKDIYVALGVEPPTSL
ncbi:MAG TPA: hypothetical protein VLH18_02185, partial [Candidatus Limnocylindrales bacterium]|nr:hypothetical protein [Candidatus Limnocylindrales bacterium]